MNASACRSVVCRAARCLGTGLCVALTLALVVMAFAVLAQALAVLVLALLSAALLLPHPPAWYAARGGEAAGAFVDALVASLSAGRTEPEPKVSNTTESESENVDS